MSDEVLTCVDCGQIFFWTQSEQRHYRERNYSAPKRCPECRQRRFWDQAKGGDIPIRSQALRDWPPQTAPRGAPASPRTVSPVTRVSARSSHPEYISWWAKPVYRFTAITFGLAILVALVMRWSAPSLDTVFCWLFAITVITILTYGYDKTIAGTESTRVPEKVLLALTFMGGTMGALIGMSYFHHKTVKAEFQHKLWLVLAVQVVLLILWFAWLSPLLQPR